MTGIAVAGAVLIATSSYQRLAVYVASIWHCHLCVLNSCPLKPTEEHSPVSGTFQVSASVTLVDFSLLAAICSPVNRVSGG